MNPDDWKRVEGDHYTPSVAMTTDLLKAMLRKERAENEKLKTVDHSLFNVVRFYAAVPCHNCQRQEIAKSALASYLKAKGRD